MDTKSILHPEDVGPAYESRFVGGVAPKMAVERLSGIPKVRRIYSLIQIGPNINYGVHNSNCNALERAILERVFFVKANDGFAPPPYPCRELFNERLSMFKAHLQRFLPSTTPVTFDEFIGLYKGRKKTIYARACDVLRQGGVERKHAYLSSFVKAEKINFTAKPDPAPRVIQPRHPVYNAAVGIYLKPVEHVVYNCIARVFGEVTVNKGLNAAETGRLIADKWGRYHNPVAVGLDASRFDQHVSDIALQWEHSIYLKMYKNDPELARLLNWQIDNIGYGRTADGTIKYRTRGCRMSGDMNTALGNCLLMCAMVYAYLKHAKVGKFSLINNGDDCVVFFERRKLDRIRDLGTWFLDMGFNMKVEDPVYELERVEFCQSQPVFDGDSYVMVRNVHTSLAKDLVTTKAISNARAWATACSSIADCGLALAGDMPILGEYYRCLLRAGNGKIDQTEEWCGMRFMALRMSKHDKPVSEETRFSFYLAFGIEPDRQIAIEKELQRWNATWRQPLPCEVFDYLQIY